MKRVSAFLFTVIFLLGVMPATALAAPKDLKAATVSELQKLSPARSPRLFLPLLTDQGLSPILFPFMDGQA